MTPRNNTALMRRLVEDVGPRWSGHSATGNHRAAEMVRDAFADIGIGADARSTLTLQHFPFTGWELTESPTLTLLSPDERDVLVALMEYSGRATGVEGVIRSMGQAHVVPGFLDWPQYGIFDDDGQLLVILVGHEGLSGWDAPPIPLHNPEPAFPYPMAMLGQVDHRRIAEELAGGARITARFSGGGGPKVCTGWNVVARIEGSRPETIVCTAHLDTSHGSPGANNNAGGVQVLKTLAEEILAEGTPSSSIEILVCDATEWGFLGSRHYLYRRAMGSAAPIIANVNVDSVTSGNEAFFVCSDEWMRARVEEAIAITNLHERFDSVTFLGAVAGSDHYSFIQKGIPASEILFWPCETYKTPDDGMAGVHEERIADAVEITRALVDALAGVAPITREEL